MSADKTESLIILFTLRCPLECSHCIVDSSPRRREELSTEAVLTLIDEAARLQIRNIGFTGGDPFARHSDLQLCVRRARQHQLNVVLITSAFWASSLHTAVAILTPYREIAMLGLSTDVYHERFTGLANIRNAIRAAREVGIPRIEVQGTGLNPSSLDSLRDSLAQDAEGIYFRFQHLWPVGRAAFLMHDSEEFLTPISALRMDCPMGAPVITPNGKINGCCSSLLNLGEDNPLSMGNVHSDGLGSCLGMLTSDPYYVFIKAFGLRALVDMVNTTELKTRLHAKYSDVCHLCHHLHSDLTTRTFLAARLREQEPKVKPNSETVS